METTQLSNGLPPVLSTEEVAELLRLNPKTVLTMARDGRLPAHRLPGCRKVQYLAAEILATVVDAPGIEEEGASENAPTARRLAAEMDPCDVWGAAPSAQLGEDWRHRCRGHWMELANRAGLLAATVDDDPMQGSRDRPSAGRIVVDGLLYEVLVGPRQRTRYVDDEGDVRWGLIDSVWVEPVEPDARSSGSW